MSQISFRDIPGITEEEIQAIEELKKQNDSFIYGMNPSTEAFEEISGVRGFAALFCEWLTKLFGIPFIPKIYEWGDLVAGLESMEIGFTGELTANDERRKTYWMTSPIAKRSIKYIQMKDSAPIHIIVTSSNNPRYAFLDGTVTVDYVERFTRYSFDTVFVDNYEAAYSLLKNGQADAFFDDSSMEAVFDTFDDVISDDFIPVIGMPVSLSTQNPLLAPIISAVQKLLENGAEDYLIHLYELGRQEHRRHRLYVRLNEEEREFIRKSPLIPFAAEHFNYPISFYHSNEKKWQGIYFDILDELSALTGLHFELANDESAIFPDLLSMLENGDVYIISELLQSEARIGRFLWPLIPTITNNYALLSKAETPNATLNEILNMKVGIPRATAFADLFYSWFPLHENVIEYDSSPEAFSALDKGDIDLVMSSQLRLLSLTNYYELSGYKANMIFSQAAESFIGFNRDQEVLRSIVDKAFYLIDVTGIASRWASVTFDYQTRLLHTQRPWFIGAIALALMVISLTTVLFIKNSRARKQLDILVQKRTNQLEIAIEAARTANKSKSAFLANMSHEIRTPMNTIFGVTEIMMQNESIPEEVEKGLIKIHNSSDMLMGIINDILDFSKIEAGKLDIKPYQYYVASLIKDSIQLNMMRIGDKPIKFEVMVDENIPAKLIGDELRIKQVLNNLLSNAFKYTEKGKVTLSVYSHPVNSNEEEGNEIMLIISIRDTGHGMTQEQLDKLFDEYSRFNDEFNRSIEGTGLGLSITQHLINLMHGRIHVESKPGAGSIFSVSLKQGKTDSEVLGKEVAANLQVNKLEKFSKNDIINNKRTRISRDPMPYGKVLVVDDVEANLYVAEGLLKPYKLKIETVMSGFAAIDKIKASNEYDIIFMDHMMPKMDGIETVRRIREMEYTAPIVALTANAVAGQSDIFLQNGFDDFISKPIDIRHLNTLLNKLVRDRQPPEVIEAAKKQLQGASQTESVMKNEANGTDILAMNLLEMNIFGMNISQGVDKFEGDTEIYLKVLRSYTNSIHSMFNTLENVNEETINEYRIAVHSIKGTSLDIFADSVGKKAKELEDAAKEKNLGFIENENPAFIENVKNLVYKIEEMLSVFDTQNTKPKKDKIDKDLLVKLHGFSQNYDMDGVDEVMEKIEKYQYESDAELYAWLRKNVDVVDFNSIAEKLGEIL